MHQSVAKDTEPADLELHDVARSKEPPVLEAAAVADGPGAEYLARVQRLTARDERDDILPAVKRRA
jgi:hypothetical protein